MRIRFIGLALLASVMVLAGCRVTFHGPVQLAPGSFVGNSLMLTNSTRTGPWPSAQDTYHFKSTSEAFDSRLNRARNWSYARVDYDTATVSITFALPNFDDAIITCALTFESRQNGTHECRYDRRTSTMFGDTTTRYGLSSGTFRIAEIGQPGLITSIVTDTTANQRIHS